MTIYYAGKPGTGYGWGVCNANLSFALGEFAPVEVIADKPVYSVDGPVFMPLRDHDFNPVHPARGTSNFGYTFFEYELGQNAAANAAKYDVVFCGSTWCLERMKERGITNGEVLVQGVDFDVFKPQTTPASDTLRIFSGGKLEYRKGQDIVVAAVKLIQKRYNATLTAQWFNPWPATMLSLSNTELLTREEVQAMVSVAESQAPYSQTMLAGIMHDTDIGIFPNRCEGGTNLVLMEYLACGKPAVVSNGTGHLDIITHDNCVTVNGTIDEKGWCHVTPEAVADAVGRARNFKPNVEPIRQWTWQRMAAQVYGRMVDN